MGRFLERRPAVQHVKNKQYTHSESADNERNLWDIREGSGFPAVRWASGPVEEHTHGGSTGRLGVNFLSRQRTGEQVAAVSGLECLTPLIFVQIPSYLFVQLCALMPHPCWEWLMANGLSWQPSGNHSVPGSLQPASIPTSCWSIANDIAWEDKTPVSLPSLRSWLA